ncbi:helix-turn-helix domain-containing protein [Bacillus xiapuensis]|uniref:helix-turn-helix domain-containing protein n=1 Tax=Bacillus xiapuensis TaxID=2014075 RepID=UPI000C231992|nr:helix-turn-helix transcriptional regulator [Bacillus xiapuensis]
METDQWGRRIRAFRKLKGYTQERLAQKLGLSISVLGDIERGYRPLSKELMQQIADELQIQADELRPPKNKVER